MKNLRIFTTEDEYNEAEISFPAVSWITSTDNLHYDLSEKSPLPTDDIMLAFFTNPNAEGNDIVLYDCGGSDVQDYINNIKVYKSDELIYEGTDCAEHGAAENDSNYLVKYDIKDTSIGEVFSTELGVGGGEGHGYEFLIPSNITSIDFLPMNYLDSLVVLATTPPTLGMATSDLNIYTIYVPDDAVTDYQSEWIGAENKIQPLSNYQGALPV